MSSDSDFKSHSRKRKNSKLVKNKKAGANSGPKYQSVKEEMAFLMNKSKRNPKYQSNTGTKPKGKFLFSTRPVLVT